MSVSFIIQYVVFLSQVIADCLSGLLFKNKRDRKMVCVDPKVQVPQGVVSVGTNVNKVTCMHQLAHNFASPWLHWHYAVAKHSPANP